jgi:aminoglycoside/choline kinase family phosphotransferase
MQAPTNMSELDEVWLGHVLGSDVDSFTTEIIGTGEGFMGQLARVHVTGSGLPERVIVKMPTSDPGGRMIGEMMRVWEREHRFYTEVAPSLPQLMPGVHVPRCLHSRTDPYVLVLEDLHPLRPGDQVAGPTLEQAQVAIDAAAALHGSWFDRPELHELTWMPDISDPMSASVGAMFDMGWPTFLARYEDSLPERVLRWCEAFAPQVVNWIQTYSEWPLTLIHGDFRLDNMFFGPDGSMTLIDWQLSMRAPSTTDLVYFLGTNLPTDMRRAVQDDLIERYSRAMRAGGVPVEWADPQRITQGYAEGCLFYCTSFAASILTLDTANERGASLMDSLVRRAFSAADDLDAGARLGFS